MEAQNPHFVIPSEPGFPATLHWTQPRVRFSVGENRMKSVNANKINRKSGEAEGAAVRPGWLPKLQVLTQAILDVAPEAAQLVIVDHPRRLHPGIDDHWTNKLETTLFE